MRLRGQVILAVWGAALVCSGVGVVLLVRHTATAGAALLDGELSTGERALERQWQLRRAERRGIYRTIASQTLFRTYLRSGDRDQMSYFATQVRSAGGDAVAILDADGKVLASDGEGAKALAVSPHLPMAGSETLLKLDGALADVYSILIGGDQAVGLLLVANRIDAAALRADAEPFGVEAAAASEDAFVTTLGGDIATAVARLAASSTEREATGELGASKARYRVRIVPFAGGRLLVAVPLSRVDRLTTDVARLVGAVLSLTLLFAGGGALIVIDRVAAPIERLTRAVDKLHDGELAACIGMLQRFTSRRDEIGDLSRALGDAARRLGTVVSTSGALSSALDRALAVVDRSADEVAHGTQRQERRLADLAAIFGPLGEALEAAAVGLDGAQSAGRTLSVSVSDAERGAAEGAGGAVRTLAILNEGLRRVHSDDSTVGAMATRMFGEAAREVAGAAESLDQHRQALRKLTEQAGLLRARLEEAVSARIREKDRGGVAKRAIAEIRKVAEGNVTEAASLRRSATALRHDVARLNEVLAVFTVQDRRDVHPPAPAASDERDDASRAARARS